MLHNYHGTRANSVFWSRALNIPLPHSYVFPQTQVEDSNFSVSKDSENSTNHISSGELVSGRDEKGKVNSSCHIK
jgi:hypothetical protein